MLELDELWSFVYRRADKRWVWLALCRRTRQIVAFAVGDRGAQTCKRLWRRVPPPYRRLLCFTDFLRRPASELGGLRQSAPGDPARGHG